MKLRKIISILTLLAILSTTVGGYLYYLSLEKNISEKEYLKGDALVRDIARRLDLRIMENKRLLSVIAGEETFKQVLTENNTRTLSEADSALDRFHNTLDKEVVCYLLDVNGNTIASSNRNTPESFKGKNYSFRPYFKEALQGMPSVYVAVGVTSKKRGIYYSHPVYGKDLNLPAGVLVIKQSITHFQDEFNGGEHPEGNVLLTDPQGVIFISNRGDWLYNVLWEVSPDARKKIASSRQFGKGPWIWTGIKRENGQHVIAPSGKKEHIHSAELLNYPGWNVIFLHKDSAVNARLISSLLNSGGYVILPVFISLLVSFIVFYRLAGHEIKRRFLSEAEAKKAAQEWYRTFDSISDFVSLHDKDFRIIKANRAVAEFFGVKKDDIHGKFCYEIYHARQSPFPDCPHMGMLASGKPHTGEHYNASTGRYLMSTVSPVINDRGELTGSVHVARDITEKKLNENKVRLFRNLIDHSNDAVFVIDPQTGRFLDVNHKACSNLGYSNEELLNMNVIDIEAVLSDHSAWEERVEEVREKGHVSIERELKHKDGYVFPVEIAINFISEKNNNYMIAIARDITERKKEEEERIKLEEQLRQSQKMEAVGQLAGGVAHDFNNILSAIINYNYIMRDMTPGDPEYLNASDEILSLANRAVHITRSLLSYSRKQIFELKALHLNEVLKNIESFICNFIGEDIELVTIASEDDPVIMADKNHIEQCIMNLATNARDAMPDGGRLTIKLEVTEMNDDFIHSHNFGVPGTFALISVTDTGMGMNKETRQKIFDPFFTTKEVGKGTGLGLSMIYGITKQHKGYIDVYSRPGHGTTFRLYFPLIKEETELNKTGRVFAIDGKEKEA